MSDVRSPVGALLSYGGGRDAALTAALAIANQPQADAAAWSRVGDVNMAMDRPAGCTGESVRPCFSSFRAAALARRCLSAALT